MTRNEPLSDLERLAAALDVAWDAGELTPITIEASIAEFRARHPYPDRITDEDVRAIDAKINAVLPRDDPGVEY